MENDAMSLLLKHMEDDKKSLISALSDGVAKDYAEYKHLCGQIMGISKAQLRVSEMNSRLQNDEDD
jgi:hypothetical protein